MRDPRSRPDATRYDPIGFTDQGDPIWPTFPDPEDDPFRIRVRTPDPPNCSGVPGTWRLRSDNISIETTSLFGDATLRAIAPGMGKFRVRHDIETLPQEWLDYGDAFKVDHVDLVPHETRAGTGEDVIGVALEFDVGRVLHTVANGNGSFDAGRYDYDPAAPEETDTAENETDTETTPAQGTGDRVAVLSTIPAWKLLAVESEREGR